MGKTEINDEKDPKGVFFVERAHAGATTILKRAFRLFFYLYQFPSSGSSCSDAARMISPPLGSMIKR